MLNESKELYCPKCKVISIFQSYESKERPGYFGGQVCQQCGWDNVGGITHYSLSDYHPYKIICGGCGKVNILFTQGNDYPEYHTNVGLICECGVMIWFELPVN